MKLLLHSCCGPCGVAVIRALFLEGLEESLSCYYHNPNIHPYQEWRSRLNSFWQLMEHYKLPAYAEESYPLEQWLQAVAPKPVERCDYCYTSRLEATAQKALELGCTDFSTTLLISPYQQHQYIRELGEEIGQKYGLHFFYRDWRPHFRAGQTAAREMGLYMQKYCGCIYSEKERYCKERNYKERNYKEKSS